MPSPDDATDTVPTANVDPAWLKLPIATQSAARPPLIAISTVARIDASVIETCEMWKDTGWLRSPTWTLSTAGPTKVTVPGAETDASTGMLAPPLTSRAKAKLNGPAMP